MQIAAIMLIVVMCPSHIAQPVFVLILHCLLIHLMGSLVISLNAIAVAPNIYNPSRLPKVQIFHQSNNMKVSG